MITLIWGTSSLANPIQFRRSQDFSISSYLQLKCNGSLSTITKWTINNCTSICSNQIEIGQSVSTTLSELFIPARTLAYGTYELKLTVTMVASPSLTSSASAYVKITPSGITPNLVQFGTSMINRGHQQDLTLDPGTFSVDPDSETFNASVSHPVSFTLTLLLLNSFIHRTGIISTIVESMIATIFRTSMVLRCQSMIPQLIPSIHRAYRMDQVQ
jgi:hypothetical protein